MASLEGAVGCRVGWAMSDVTVAQINAEWLRVYQNYPEVYRIPWPEHIQRLRHRDLWRILTSSRP